MSASEGGSFIAIWYGSWSPVSPTLAILRGLKTRPTRGFEQNAWGEGVSRAPQVSPIFSRVAVPG
jgi:hypothetical protein